jgi:hypothetical protein
MPPFLQTKKAKSPPKATWPIFKDVLHAAPTDALSLVINFSAFCNSKAIKTEMKNQENFLIIFN